MNEYSIHGRTLRGSAEPRVAAETMGIKQQTCPEKTRRTPCRLSASSVRLKDETGKGRTKDTNSEQVNGGELHLVEPWNHARGAQRDTVQCTALVDDAHGQVLQLI